MGGVSYAPPHTEAEPGEPAASAPRSLLLLDCGAVFTKVALVARIEDRYRLLARAQAPTTWGQPAPDLMVGVLDAVAALERVVGRSLLEQGHFVVPERSDGTGVDAVAASMSAGGPLRLLTTGPGRESVAGLLYKSLGGLFVQLETLVAMPAGAAASASEWQQITAQVRALQPHGILVAGAPFGDGRQPGGMRTTLQTVARWLDELRAIPAEDSRALRGMPVLFTGNADEGTAVTAALQGHGCSVTQVETLTPSTLAPLSRAVRALYEGVVLRQAPGYAALRAALSASPMAAQTALGGMVRYLARHYQMSVVGVDVGATATSLAAATAAGEFLPAAQPTVGVGPGAGQLLRATGAANIQRWLTWPASESDVREYVLARQLRPWSVPATARDLEIEHALTREAIRLAVVAPGSRLAGLNPLDVVLGTGGVLANMPHPALAALVLLDALQPRGITSLVLDTAGIAAMLGSAAMLSPEAAAELSEGDAVPLVLGSVISATGEMHAGEPAVRVLLEYADGRQQTQDVVQGTLARLALAPGDRALLSLFPAATIDIGLGPGQQARASDPVEGGALGLIVDARGRPIQLPAATDARMAQLMEWRRALGWLEG